MGVSQLHTAGHAQGQRRALNQRAVTDAFSGSDEHWCKAQT